MAALQSNGKKSMKQWENEFTKVIKAGPAIFAKANQCTITMTTAVDTEDDEEEEQELTLLEKLGYSLRANANN